jgi:DNA-binding response OmpR family regulator
VPVLFCGDLSLDRVRRVLSHGGRSVELTVRECELLEYLIRRQGQDVSRDDLARDVWREPVAGLTNVIDVYVSYLRKKLTQLNHSTVIRTVRGVGYRLET